MSNKLAVFEVQGGIGKNVAFTGALDAYKKSNPDRRCIVAASWPEVFLRNPDVERVYPIGNTPHFYQDFIYNQDAKIFVQDPYRQESHIHKKTQLIETWCDMFDVPYTNNSPKLFINEAEKTSASIMHEKPILLFQPFGGPGKDHQPHVYSWTRDIPPHIAQKMVDVFSQKFHVLHVCYDFHPHLNNCERFDQTVPKKVLFAMLLGTQARVLIDSSLQHAAAALGLKSHVFWIATQPEVFGYNLHNNHKPIIDMGNGTIDSYLYDYNFNGPQHECPYDDSIQLFDYDKIISEIMS